MNYRQFYRKFFQMTVIILAFGLVVSGPVVADQVMPGKGITVKPARATWTTGFFIEAVYSRAIEHLGYDVKDPKKLANPIFFQSVFNGDVDFWANGWFPLHFAQLPKDFDKKATYNAGIVVKSGALQGYLASKREVDKFGIKSLDDFKRDEVKKAFDANGDGKADLVGCPPGWGCQKVQDHHLKVYGLEDHVNIIRASYTPAMADALARYADEKPILYYTWTPNWTVNRLKPGKDVMWINVPKTIPSDAQKGAEKTMEATGIKGAVSDPIKMGYAANNITVVANNEFLAKNPAIKRLFEVMSIPLDDIARQNNRMFAGENTEKDIERHVTEWIALNKERWDGWLAEARKVVK